MIFLKPNFIISYGKSKTFDITKILFPIFVSSTALKFALGYSNEIDSLPSDFRQFTGYVEVSFVSSATVTHQTVRRSINGGHIEYFIDGESVERVVAKKNVKLMGIIQSHPFQYAIQCDDIDAVVASDAKQRYKWLLECCGLREYNISKQQSVRLFHETMEEIDKIKVALWKIDSHLQMFIDHEEQAILQKWEQRVKDLGHMQCKRNMEQLQQQIAKFDVEIAISGGTVAKYGNEVMEYTNELRTRQVALKTAKQKIADLQQNRKSVQGDLVGMSCRKQTLENSVLELRSQIECAQFVQWHSLQEKQLLQQSIQNSESELDNLQRKLSDLQRLHDGYEQRLTELEEQRRMIFVQSAQNQRLERQWMSIDERNTALHAAIDKANAGSISESRSVKRFQTDIQRQIASLQDLKKTRAGHVTQLKELKADTIDEDTRKQKERCDELVQRSR